MTETVRDVVGDRLIAEFTATLGSWLFAVPDEAAPLGLHWCLAPRLEPTEQLGPDGHPPRHQTVSAEDFPRRMWVGGALIFMAPLRRGQLVTRMTDLGPLVMKNDGAWCLSTADHRFEADGNPLISERQDIAFRRPAAPRTATVRTEKLPLPQADLSWEVETSPTLLFRYSALTFNGHRIHYDHPYATQVEGYAGLIVHGPLQATILLNLAATLLGRPPRSFAYRATAPLIAGLPLRALEIRTGDRVALSVHGPDGKITMTAQADAD